jgi:hypothetical protein
MVNKFFKTIIYLFYKLGPWDEKTGIFAPLFHQHYQVDGESLRNVVSLINNFYNFLL